MFCPTCGTQLADGSAFCKSCGRPLAPMANAAPMNGPAGLFGFSPRIADPAFARYRKKSASWSLLFAAILAVIAIVAFPIYGNASGEIDWPDSLYYGLGIGGMFILIALIQTLRRGTDKTWDGVVVDRQSWQVRENDDGHISHHTIYQLKIQKEGGGIKKHKWRDIPGPYGYYAVGDRVRHHKGFQFYEKLDKSRDAQIMCAACLSFVDIREEHCPRCKCPLLKNT